jgi:retinol dehydrogenase-12
LTKNAKVYLAARSEDRAKAAIEDLKLTTGNEAIWLKLDLASLNSIKAAAEEFLEWVLSDFS